VINDLYYKVIYCIFAPIEGGYKIVLVQKLIKPETEDLILVKCTACFVNLKF